MTKRFVYDREDIIAEYDGAGALQATYIHGPGIDEPLEMKRGGVNYYYQRDGLDSIVGLANASGTVVRSYRYDSFGRLLGETGTVENPYIYTGRERDAETGMYYYRARYYDPLLGRFISEDPIGFASGDENFYNYVYANPTNFIDPFGHGILSAAELGAPGVGGTPLSLPAPTTGNLVETPFIEVSAPSIGDVAFAWPLLIPALEEAVIYTGAAMTAIIGATAIIKLDKSVPPPNVCPSNYLSKSKKDSTEHTKNLSPSKKNKHEKGQRRKEMDKLGGEKGDFRRPFRR